MMLSDKYKTITFRATFIIGSIVIVLITSLIIYTAVKFAESETTAAKENLMVASKDLSNQVKLRINKAFDMNKFNRNTLTASLRGDSTPVMNRNHVFEYLKEQLKSAPDFLGIYTVWEPDAYDGQDTLYRNQPPHDETGRLIPYAVRSKGEVRIDPNIKYEEEGTGDYYIVPRKEKKEVILDPYKYPIDGNEVLLVSAVTPIIINDEFKGIAGVDFSIDFMQELVQNVIFSGAHARVSILTNKGTIVAMSAYPQYVGKNIKDLPEGFEKSTLQGDKNSEIFEGNGIIKACTLLELGDTGTPWQLCVAVPESVITEKAVIMTWKLAGIGIVFITGLIFFLIYLLRKMLSPIENVIQAAEKMVEGDLDYKLIDSTSTEIVKLNHAFSKVLKNQKEITDVCTSISKGDFNNKVTVKSDKDLLSISVNEMIDNLKAVSEEDAKRNWATAGLAKFSEILRADKDLKVLGDNIVSNLVKYLGANQAWFFVVNEESREKVFLNLVSCYAFDRKKFLKKEIEIGEGLSGQCYLEQATIYLTEIPSDFVKITSGTGQATPTCLLIVPLMVNEKVEGVLEIASFREFEPHVIQFVEKLSESIASSISAVRINEKTRHLLEQSQQHTEELRAQEEEMRQNMEELAATQEELERKEQLYIAQIESLKSENEQLKAGLQ